MMNPEEHQDSEQPAENWLSNFEDQCLDDLESEPNMEDRLQAEKEYAVKKLWLTFQNSATAIAQLYKDRQQGLSMWVPFQNAAISVTSLYKDSVDTVRNCIDMGVQCGRQHKTRDIIAWAKKKRRHIRREELLAFLCGKNPPPRNRLGVPQSRPPSRVGLDLAAPCLPADEKAIDNDLEAFREAIALQGLNGAMSNISVGYNLPHTPGAQAMNSLPRNNIEELNRFIHDEFSRNRKRTSSPDVIMDSPSRKRSRLI
ncbi:HUWE1-associated protein modifying stress responses-like [Haliotis asinina]|uniref:HUWE1-associated protein modifying stress responses-like n=1 Tax=Haliotis asinina TaxID=109174 RepID=UPI003531B470